MLALNNEARADAGVPPVELGDNRAAQIHAENLAKACAGGHWELDGTKPAMRYSLADGYQVNAENVSGLDWCDSGSLPAALQIKATMESVLESPGHLGVILDPVYRKVNMGLAFNHHNDFTAVQQFEGDYVDSNVAPASRATCSCCRANLRTVRRCADQKSWICRCGMTLPPGPRRWARLPVHTV